jgi:hypothetical protein
MKQRSFFPSYALLLAAASCGGIKRSTTATGDAGSAVAGTAGPWCCNANGGPSDGCSESKPSGQPCPNANNPEGPPTGWYVSLQVTPEAGCMPPVGFTMGVSLSESGYPQSVARGWCLTYDATAPTQGGHFTCVFTRATGPATDCAFTTLANYTAATNASSGAPVWTWYCLDPADMKRPTDYAYENETPPWICDSTGSCCYPAIKFTSLPVQPRTNATAGF